LFGRSTGRHEVELSRRLASAAGQIVRLNGRIKGVRFLWRLIQTIDTRCRRDDPYVVGFEGTGAGGRLLLRRRGLLGEAVGDLYGAGMCGVSAGLWRCSSGGGIEALGHRRRSCGGRQDLVGGGHPLRLLASLWLRQVAIGGAGGRRSSWGDGSALLLHERMCHVLRRVIVLQVVMVVHHCGCVCVRCAVLCLMGADSQSFLEK